MANDHKLSGELLSLVPPARTRWSDLYQRFQDRELYNLIGLKRAPEQQWFFNRLEQEKLVIFDMIPHEGRKSLGYAFVVYFDGSPYTALCFFNDFDNLRDLDLAADAVLQILIDFFRRSDEPRLYFFLDRPVPVDIHDRLLEGGFDFHDDYPAIDNDVEACYGIERFTYEAYYRSEDIA